MKISLLRLFRRASQPMMTCGDVGTLLQFYLDGELDDARSARLATHLDDCRRCGLEADTYRRIKHSLAAHKNPVPADSLARLRQFGEQLARGDGASNA